MGEKFVIATPPGTDVGIGGWYWRLGWRFIGIAATAYGPVLATFNVYVAVCC